MAALDLIMARVADFRRRKPLRAVPLIVTVFGDAVAPHGARVWLGSLMRLLAPLGVSERLARTSVYRLAQEHWLRAETAGRKSDYLLTDFGRRQFEQATRHIYSITRPSWDGRWRMVVALPGAWNAGEREHLRRSLAWQGFGKLDSGVYLHPGASLDEALAALELVADSYLSVATPVQVAAAQLLRAGAAVRAAIRQRIQQNLDALRAAARGFPACEVLRTEGGWSAVVRVPATRPEERLVLDLLERERILVHPGYFFDFPREAYLVVSLLPPPALFADACARLLRVVSG